jgi:hypothetical protein
MVKDKIVTTTIGYNPFLTPPFPVLLMMTKAG